MNLMMKVMRAMKIEAEKRLKELGRSVGTWILRFFFPDGLSEEKYREFDSMAHTRLGATLNGPSSPQNHKIDDHDPIGHTTIEGLLQLQLQREGLRLHIP